MSVIVFAGDSITDSDRRTDRLGLGYGYVNLVAAALRDHGQHSTVVNAGVAGDRVEHLQGRWQADVLDQRPSALSVYIGVNDTLAAFFAGRPGRRRVRRRERDPVRPLKSGSAVGVRRTASVLCQGSVRFGDSTAGALSAGE